MNTNTGNDLDRRDIDEIKQLHERLQKLARTALDDALAIGEKLNRIKSTIPHGNWKTWVSDNLPFSIRKAQMYMALDKNRDHLKNANISFLQEAQRLLPRKTRQQKKADASPKEGEFEETIFSKPLTTGNPARVVTSSNDEKLNDPPSEERDGNSTSESPNFSSAIEERAGGFTENNASTENDASTEDDVAGLHSRRDDQNAKPGSPQSEPEKRPAQIDTDVQFEGPEASRKKINSSQSYEPLRNRGMDLLACDHNLTKGIETLEKTVTRDQLQPLRQAHYHLGRVMKGHNG